MNGNMNEKESFELDKRSGWSVMKQEEKEEAFAFCQDYMRYLDRAKTERESVSVMIEEAKAHGFVDFDACVRSGAALKPGMRVYADNRGKALILAVIGNEDPTQGLAMVGAHVDAPRLDFKPCPLYEDGGLTMAKTHYYGGIKKYQWVAVPLALHGVLVRKDGTQVTLCVGEDETDPVFYISDLLPHLSAAQMEQTGAKLISGEQLNVMLGSIPGECDGQDDNGKKAEGKNAVKRAVLALLHEKYGIVEEDFLRAEIEVVPAAKARDVGFDRGLVGAYAQDDRVCAYTAFRALLDLQGVPAHTAACYFSDKEEIGSVGNTGARSNWVENFILELCHACNKGRDAAVGDMLACRRAMAATRFLSADVTAAFDPNFPDVSDKINVAYAGNGVALEKYTGSRGKSGASDASAEFVADVTRIFDAEHIPWQLTEMGKVDAGGGGTIAQYMTDLGMDVLDCGVPVLAMHSPFELTSKADVYWTYRAYLAFFRA